MNVGVNSRNDVVRVFVADNSPIHTALLSDALRRDGLEIVCSQPDSSGLIPEVSAGNIDVLVIAADVQEQPGRGFEVLRELRVSCPRIRTLILLTSSKPELILEAFRAGARGVFSRNGSVDMLVKAIQCVHGGQIWANSREMSLALEALASFRTVHAVNYGGVNLLSKRETDVVECVAQGLSNREIAERLGLSQHTIKNYLFRVFDKLGVSSRVELLFMTLSQAPSDRIETFSSSFSCSGQDSSKIAACERAAEEGALSAQVLLAQVYSSAQSDPERMLEAYMWYMIAADRLSNERDNSRGTLSPELALEAERRAAAWLKNRRGVGLTTSSRRA